jgi:hypothetical protein
VVQTEEAGGLEITVRGDARLPGTFTGASDQLAKLTTEVAEYVYSQSQPALWAAYLVNSGRYQDAITFCELSISSSSLSEHSGLLNYRAIAISKSSGAGPLPLALIEKAIALQPDYWYAYNELTIVKIELGDEEGAWRVGEDLRKAAGGRPGRAPEVDYGALDSITWNLPGMLAGLTADAQSTSGNGTLSFSAEPQFALVEALIA